MKNEKKVMSLEELTSQFEQLAERVSEFFYLPDRFGNTLASYGQSARADSKTIVELSKRVGKIETKLDVQKSDELEELRRINDIYLRLLEDRV